LVNREARREFIERGVLGKKKAHRRTLWKVKNATEGVDANTYCREDIRTYHWHDDKKMKRQKSRPSLYRGLIHLIREGGVSQSTADRRIGKASVSGGAASRIIAERVGSPCHSGAAQEKIQIGGKRSNEERNCQVKKCVSYFRRCQTH